jgi:hypothetical protein
MNILLVGAELHHADGQTHRHDEDNSRFSKNCEKRLNTAGYDQISIAQLNITSLETEVIQGAAYGQAVLWQIAGSYSLLRI